MPMVGADDSPPPQVAVSVVYDLEGGTGTAAPAAGKSAEQQQTQEGNGNDAAVEGAVIGGIVGGIGTDSERGARGGSNCRRSNS